jgi:hypothetical protein
MPKYNFNLLLCILKLALHICFLLSVFICLTSCKCLLLNLIYIVANDYLKISNQ